MPIDDKIKAAGEIYGDQSIDYFVGALDAAYRECECIEKALGAGRIQLHNRLDQMAALIGKTSAMLAAREKGNE